MNNRFASVYRIANFTGIKKNTLDCMAGTGLQSHWHQSTLLLVCLLFDAAAVSANGLPESQTTGQDLNILRTHTPSAYESRACQLLKIVFLHVHEPEQILPEFWTA